MPDERGRIRVNLDAVQQKTYDRLLEECRNKVLAESKENWKKYDREEKVNRDRDADFSVDLSHEFDKDEADLTTLGLTFDKSEFLHSKAGWAAIAAMDLIKSGRQIGVLVKDRAARRDLEEVNGKAIEKLNEYNENIVDCAALELMNKTYGTDPKYTKVCEKAKEVLGDKVNEREDLVDDFELLNSLYRFISDDRDLDGDPEPFTPQMKYAFESSFEVELNLSITDEKYKDMGDIRNHAAKSFHAEAPPNVDIGKFTEKMLNGGKITQGEMKYAVQTFDQNFISLNGDGMKDFEPDDENYLSQFDEIFIDGKPVSEICAAQIENMDDRVAQSNFMKCYVTAAALERKKSIEVDVPDFTDPKGEKSRIIQMNVQVTKEPPQKLTLWQRVVSFFVGKPPTTQEKYDKSGLGTTEGPKAKEQARTEQKEASAEEKDVEKDVEKKVEKSVEKKDVSKDTMFFPPPENRKSVSTVENKEKKPAERNF